jgi:hypothetical protein
MTAATSKPDPVLVFTERASARAMLVDLNFIPLQQAVDELWADAERDGLVAERGADEIQKLLGVAFKVKQP